EALLFLAAERVGDQLLLAQGVDVGAVDLELVMQVWPGGKTGGADVADDLALLDRSAGANVLGEALHVGIERPVAGAVLDDHGVAVTALGTGEDHLAVPCRLDRRAAGRGVVHSLVGADLVEDGMLAALREA